MRSHVLRIAVCAILLTGYAYAQSAPTLRRQDEGTTLYMAILTFADVIERCYLKTPNGLIVEFKPNDESNDKFKLLPDTEIMKCRANVTNINMYDNGLWTINSVAASGLERSQSYDLTVIPAPDTTPETEESTEIDNIPEIEDDLQTEDLDGLYFNTTMGARHSIFIRDYAFVTSERCLLIAPSGKQYNLEELNVSYIKISQHREATCAIVIEVISENVIGNWTLIAEGRRFSERIRRRLPFSIYVEEIVDASLRDVIVVEGNDFYVRLRNSIHNYDTCRLLGADGNEYDSYETDSRYIENCGYIVRNVKTTDSGNWEIVYGDKIIYRAPINVTVNVGTSGEALNVKWTKDRAVEATFGGEDVIYCRLRSPDGLIMYDGSGRCHITIDRVTTAHSGIWKMNVGLPGRVLTENSEIHVTVVEAEPKPTVTTRVVANKPTVSLSCQVSSPYPIRSCQFRDPSGRILLANEGVGESRYSFHGSGVSYESNLHTHDCGLQITDPIVQDLGLWRCSVETAGDTYYGFLRVLCPWAMRDPEVVAAIILDPILTADRDIVSNVVGDSVSMSCSIQSAIRYCYFRARNGTLFSVGPADPHDQATYVGAGFDAGECGIRFPSLAVSDTGAWSCHVGLLNAHERDQRARIDVTVHDSMMVYQRIHNGQLFVEAQVYNQRALEYCRFVRIDGLGFTTETIPSNYFNRSELSEGYCGISIVNPSILDNHPWTIVARIRGQDVELSRVTTTTLTGPNPPPEGGVIYYHLPVAWIVVMAVGLAMVLLAILIGPKSNRRWTYERASAIRNSFIKKKAEQQNNPEKNTAVAA